MAAFTRAGSATGNTSGAQSVTGLSIPANSIVVIWAADRSTTSNASTPTDSAGNTYAIIGAAGNGTNAGLVAWSTYTTVSLTSIGATTTANQWIIGADYEQIAGGSAANALDQAAGTTGQASGTSYSVGPTAALSATTDLAWAAAAQSGGSGSTVSAGAGYTALAQANNGTNIGVLTEYQQLASAAAVSAGFSLSVQETGAAVIGVFKQAAAAAATRELMLTGVGI